MARWRRSREASGDAKPLLSSMTESVTSGESGYDDDHDGDESRGCASGRSDRS